MTVDASLPPAGTQRPWCCWWLIWPRQNYAKKPEKNTETLVNGYSSESTLREQSNEYQHDRVSMVFRNLGILVLWTKVASALEGLRVIVDAWRIPKQLNLWRVHCSQSQGSLHCDRHHLKFPGSPRKIPVQRFFQSARTVLPWSICSAKCCISFE